MQDVHNDDVLSHILWCVSHLADGGESQVRALLELGIAPSIVKAMGREEDHLRSPAIRAVGNFLTECDELTTVMVENGLIPALADHLTDRKRIIRKEVCWALSNLLAGSVDHIEQVFVYKDRWMIRKLLDMLKTDHAEVRTYT